MPTIEQARSDRARENLARSIEQQEIAQHDLQGGTSRSDIARAELSRSGLQRGDGVDDPSPPAATSIDQTAIADTAMFHTASGENPFGALVAGAPQGVYGTEQLVLGEALPLGAELAPGVEQMVKMAALQASGFKQSAAGMMATSSKIRVGTMLLLADDATSAGETLGDAKSNADALAGTIAQSAGSDEHIVGTIISQHVMTSQFPAGMDVNAYVEQVLREAYMIQQGVLEDYATEMDQINSTRKAMRDRLSRLNALKSKASTGSASVNDLADLGITLDPGDVDNLGGAGFAWPKQAELEEAEDQLASLQGQPLTHQADIKALNDEETAREKVQNTYGAGSNLQAELQTLTAKGTSTPSQPVTPRPVASGAIAEPVIIDNAMPTAGANAALSTVAGDQLPGDAASSAKARQIEDARDRVQELMKEKVDAVAADSSHSDDAKTFLSNKIDAAIDTQKGDLDGANGDAEMMQLQLQDAMQKSQELMQMMSNMSKVLHDTVMSVIRNIGG